MSRKHILGVDADAPTVASLEAQDRTRSLPLMGVARKEKDASTRLTSSIGNSLREQNSRVERAEEIERRLAEGQTVIDLDPSEIDPSFVQDRMEGDIDGLMASIRDQGQQVPILVRPHPEQTGRYQVAFGHRRLRAITELGLRVRAIVRDMTDEHLVIAQGQENNERQDLSFIEKARFAARLGERFSREVIIAAMSIDKSNLSKMLILVESLPAALIDAIGPAPGIGRPSWQQMADFVEKSPSSDAIIDYARSTDIQGLPSPERFKAVLAMKPRRVARSLPDILSNSAGERLATVTQSKSKLEISIDRKASADFAAFILQEVPALFEEHLAKRKLKTGE